MSADTNFHTTEEARSGIGRAALRMIFGFVLATGFALVCIALVAVAVYFWDVSEKWTSPIVSVLSLLSLFFGAKIALRGRAYAFWCGVGAGALYHIFLAGMGMFLAKEAQLSLRSVLLTVISMLVGGVGAVSAKNKPAKKRKRKTKRK